MIPDSKSPALPLILSTHLQLLIIEVTVLDHLMMSLICYANDDC